MRYIELDRDIRIVLSNGHTVHGRLHELYMDQVGFYYAGEAKVGAHLSLNFNLEIAGHNYAINTPCEVLFSNLHGSCYHVGARLIDLSRQQQNLVYQYICSREIHSRVCLLKR